MIWFPAVAVHGADHVAEALTPGRPVLLLSGPGAALYAGVGWWRALIMAGREAFPATPAQDMLDCADAPGRAMEALRHGQQTLILAPCPASSAVAAAAATLGATVLQIRPPSLDLATPGAARRLVAWLTAS